MQQSMADQKTILIAEDEADLSNALRVAFEAGGFDVVIAGTGKAMVDMVEAAKPDFLLIDIMMPQQDGIEALTEIRSLPEFAQTPAIILTALAHMQEIVDLINERNLKAEYLIKTDWTLDALVQKVSEVLQTS